MSMHVYRGFEIYPLIYPHAPALDGSPHNYDAGFDAAVKICLRGDTLTHSQTFRLRDNARSAVPAMHVVLRCATRKTSSTTIATNKVSFPARLEANRQGNAMCCQFGGRNDHR